MNFIKRAILVLKGKKGRTTLLVAIFSAILIFVLAGLTIQSAALKSIEDAKESAGATATLSINRGNMREKRKNSSEESESNPVVEMPSIQLEDVNKIAALENVRSYNVSVSSSAGQTDSFVPVETSATEISEEKKMPDMLNMEGGQSFGPGNVQGDFAISGVLMNEFSDETAILTEGELLGATDVGTNAAVIEVTLADENGLSVGDTFEISSPTDEEEIYELVVKGIYETQESSNGMGMNFSFMNPENTIYTTYDFANKLKGDETSDEVDYANFVLENPKQLEAFVAEGNKLIDTQTYQLTVNDEQYQQMLEPIENISNFANKIVWLVSIAGALILGLMVMLMTRERRQEMGVLISLGESRFKVLGQIFTELIIILMLSLTIAGVSGKFVGNIVGQELLNQQTQTTSNQEMSMPNNQEKMPSDSVKGFEMGSNPFAESSEIKELEVTLSTMELLKLGGLGILITLLAVVFVAISIFRLQPKEILLG